MSSNRIGVIAALAVLLAACSVSAGVNITVIPKQAAAAKKALNAKVTPEGLELDLPAAFAVKRKPQKIRVVSEPLDVEKLRDKDILFSVELIGRSKGKPARAEVGACGVRMDGRRFDLRIPASKHYYDQSDPVVVGRQWYSMPAVVPADAKELRVRVDFRAPGDDKVVFCGVKAEPYRGEPDEQNAAVEPKVLFHLPLDGSAIAATAAGTMKPMVAKGLTYVEGRVGQALHCDPAVTSRLVFASNRNINPERGTMTCWFRRECPVKQTSGMFSLFAGKNSALGDGHIQVGWKKYADLGIFTMERGNYSNFTRNFGPRAWKCPQDVWHHLTLTWDMRKIEAYVDGNTVPPGRSGDAENPLGTALVGPRPMRFRENWQSMLKTFVIGSGRLYNSTFKGDIDDVRIWSEPFTFNRAVAYYREVTGEVRTGDEHGAPWVEPKEPLKKNPALIPPTGEAIGVPANMELVEEVFPAKIAQANDPNRFRSTGNWKVGTFDGLDYLEAGDGLNDRYAIRFQVDGNVPLWCVEVTYPDDKARAIDLVMQGVKGDGGYSLNHGIETGLEHPLTMKNATKRYLFWRGKVFDDAKQNGDLALVVMTQTKDNPAALSRIRLYAIRDGKIPDAGIVPCKAVNGMRRHFAIWFEDPAIMGDFGVQRENGVIDDQYLLIDRVSAYMKYTGHDMLIYPAVWYNGIIGANYMPRNHAPHFMREYCRRFETDGHIFVASINQQRLPQLGLHFTRKQLADGTLLNSPITVLDTGLPNWGGWHHTPTYYNISHPDVQKALLEEIVSVCRECRDYSSFGGMAIDPFNAVNFTTWGTIAAGYNDYSVDGFEKATGIKVPVDRTNPMRGREYAKWLKANAYDQWVQYRCDVLTDFYRRCAETVHAARPDLKLYIRCALNWRTAHLHPDLFKEDFPNRMLRETGIDCAALSKLPGVALAPYSISAYWHDELKSQPVSEKAKIRVRDLPETASHLTLPLKSEYPMISFHDSYYETSVGGKTGLLHHAGDGRLTGDWLTEKSWRVTHFSASGREAIRPYAKALKFGDIFAFTRGGFSLGTCGDEAVIAPFMRAFRALPAVKFADVKGFSHPDVRFRTADALGKRWYYLVNTGSETVDVSVSLPKGTKDAVSGESVPDKVPLSGYEIRAFVTR